MHTKRTKKHRDRPSEASSSSSASASAKMQGRRRVPALVSLESTTGELLTIKHAGSMQGRGERWVSTSVV